MIIAAMAVSIICLAPLFVTDSEAAEIKEGKTGASFTADSIGDEDFSKVFSDEYKLRIAYDALNTIGTVGKSDGGVPYYDITELKISDVSDVKMSVGNRVTEEYYENVASAETASTFVCTPSFASRRPPAFAAGAAASVTV